MSHARSPSPSPSFASVASAPPLSAPQTTLGSLRARTVSTISSNLPTIPFWSTSSSSSSSSNTAARSAQPSRSNSYGNDAKFAAFARRNGDLEDAKANADVLDLDIPDPASGVAWADEGMTPTKKSYRRNPFSRSSRSFVSFPRTGEARDGSFSDDNDIVRSDTEATSSSTALDTSIDEPSTLSGDAANSTTASFFRYQKGPKSSASTAKPIGTSRSKATRPPSRPRATSAPDSDGWKAASNENTPTLPSSSTQLPRGETADSDACSTASDSSQQGTLRQGLSSRSYASIRSLAAWVPGSSRFASPARSPKEGNSPVMNGNKQLVPVGKEDSKQIAFPASPRKPVKLDKRRIDKAVGLAVEAAQAAEADEEQRKERERRRKERLARRKEREEAAARQNAGIMSRIRSAGYAGSTSGDERGPGRYSALAWGSKQGGLLPWSATTSAEQSLSESSDQSDDEEEEEVDNFSLSLYLSSLSYLVSALPSKDSANLPNKEREELRAKLQEVLDDIALEAPPGAGKPAAQTADTDAEKEERLREMLESELRRAEARMMGNAANGRGRRVPSRAQSAARAAEGNSSEGGITSKLARSALELTFTVAAAGVGALNNSLSRFAPPEKQASPRSSSERERENVDGIAKILGEVPLEEKALTRVDRNGGARPVRSSTAPPAPRNNQNSLQWDLAMSLASSTATTMYGYLSVAAREAAREDPATARQIQRDGAAMEAQAEALLRQLPSDLDADYEEMPEDRLILLAASFSRSLKRSPLPSQLSALSSQLLTLLHNVDQRYSLSKRATDEALRRTRQGLGYVRRRGWHVKVVRGAWALVEMGVAGVEAWREEGLLEQEQARAIALQQQQQYQQQQQSSGLLEPANAHAVRR